MPRPHRDVLQLDHENGRRLHVIWSRSGKRLIFTTTGRAMAQATLDAGQVDTLARFLSRTGELPPVERGEQAAMRLRDDDDNVGRELHASWPRSGKTFFVTTLPAFGDDAGEVEVELRPEQAEELARFLRTSKP